MRTAVLTAVAVVLASAGAWAADIAGKPHVVDGDTIVIGETKIRLDGIDAPETEQSCLDAKGKRWACGIAARDRLDGYIGDRRIDCIAKGTDRYRRTLAICSAAGIVLNAWMVREGLALAYAQYATTYVRDEEQARRDQKGMWSGSFIAPWDWRHSDKKTAVLGAVSVLSAAQAALLAPASSAGAPSAGCTIKGNVNTRGERIYHLPGQLNYAKTRIDRAAGERWFCSEYEAQAAGWRRAAR